MLYDMPMTQYQIENKLGENCFQLLTIEGDDFTQLRGLSKIGEKINHQFPEIDLYISSNEHDFGTYYGLEVADSALEKYDDLEMDSLRIAEELGYDI